jgi:hypothetical protein
VTRSAIAAVLTGLVLAVTSPAYAAPLTVGLFAPAAPFPSTAARVELASRLGAVLGKALNRPAVGRVYARAVDFAAAIKNGEVTLALVEAAYLATTATGGAVIATSLGADDQPSRAWQLVAPRRVRLVELRGKRVLVPSLGGREPELVINALLAGAIDRAFFAVIEPAPDTASALAALALGKADAAIVPAAGELPGGTTALRALPALPNPVLVAYGALSAADRTTIAAALATFQGDATIAGFRATDSEAVRALARRFTAPARTAPFAVPAARLVVAPLAAGRALAIARTPATAFVTAPPP